jgi:hypothetical protein
MTTQQIHEHSTSRRRFIQLLGGGIVVAAGTQVAGCGTDLPSETTRAWNPIAPNMELRRFMLAHALLAPNPHNRQPWLADLSRANEITLICDAERLLPETDPFGRQILIGCGAFIELAVIAGAERGMRVHVDAFPEGAPADNALPKGVKVARLSITPDSTIIKDPLFGHIRQRHTNKAAYDKHRPLPVTLWQMFIQTAQHMGLTSGEVSESTRVAAIRRITRAGYEVECVTARTWLESARLFRFGPEDIAKHRDGISIMGAMPRLLRAVGLFDPLEVPVPASPNYTRVMERWAPFDTGSGFFWIASSGNSRQAQLNVGRAYVRAHLQATAAGVDMHPVSQALQEFPEMSVHHQDIHRLLGLAPAKNRLQMLVRVGYGTKADGPSPRRDSETLLLS